MTRDYAAEEVAANQAKAMQAIHRKPAQSRHAFLLGQASDPILSLACTPIDLGDPLGIMASHAAPMRKRRPR